MRSSRLGMAGLGVVLGGWVATPPALGSQIHYRSLEDVARKSPAIALAKIEAVSSTEGRFDVTYRFVAQVESWLYGMENVDRIEADYVFYLPHTRAASDGNGEISVSPMESGSGLEESARPGERYVLFLGGQPRDPGLSLLRIEPAERADEIGRLLIARFCGRVESIRTLENAGPTRATGVDVDPMWVLTVMVKRVQGLSDRLTPGQSHAFAIHSPTRLFAAPAQQVKGRTYSFELAPVPMSAGGPGVQRFRLEVLAPSTNDASACEGDR